MNKAEPTASANATFPTRCSRNYRTRIVSSLSEIGQLAWDALLALQSDANPFLSFAFLDALHESGSASIRSGWQPQFVTFWRKNRARTLRRAGRSIAAVCKEPFLWRIRIRLGLGRCL
jgi:predicted N-acyltransferase